MLPGFFDQKIDQHPHRRRHALGRREDDIELALLRLPVRQHPHQLASLEIGLTGTFE